MIEKFTSVLEEAPDGSGDLIMPIPPEILNELGWNEKTILDISVQEDGTIILKQL